MTESDIKLLCGDIFKALPEKKLKEAFSRIRKLVAETRQGEYTDLLYNLKKPIPLSGNIPWMDQGSGAG